MGQPCATCSATGKVVSLTTGNYQTCSICLGRGYGDSSNIHSGISAQGGSTRQAFGWLDKRRTPKERDKSFAALIGILAGAWMLWIGYSRGFGGDRIWDFAGPVIGAVILTKTLEAVTIVIRPLRWLAIVALWAALAYAALVIFQDFTR